jgi:cytoplasmic iron level regulating protein YaaA (DUF328/UPF0246 family)
VLILLPPSESKAAPARRGKPVALENLCFPDLLTDTRKAVLTALVEASGRPDAVELLGVGASLAGEVERNTRLPALPASPAHTVYTGVLYDALGWDSLSPAGRRRGAGRVLVASALFGWSRPNDRIPPYRLAMDGDLPGLGPLTRLWRAPAQAALAEAAGRRGLIVDCRSAPYAAAAPVPAELAARAVAVRVLRESAGVRSVVSHLAKHTRGEVARQLLEQDADPRTPAALRETLAATSGPDRSFELTAPPRKGTPWTLDVLLTSSL